MARLIYLVSWFLFFTPGFILAEISSPYTVDEKNQVLFGDSAVVGEYEGLQNYLYEYVEGYLHLTFTYTHHGCCFASYPPRLYITNVDPRATTTHTVRDQREVFSLLSNPTHTTDYYQYDIQFDATGYTVRVTQATTTEVINEHRVIPNQTDSDWVALANLYPAQNPTTAFSMAFRPLLIYEQATPNILIATTTPVIIIPGIASTFLNSTSGEEVWVNLAQITTSLTDSHLENLSLDTNGFERSTLVSESIIRNIGGHSFFQDLFSTLEVNGFAENESVYEFPYDWRIDIGTTASQLNAKIDQIMSERGVSSVHLIAHSMGGLLVKKYLMEFGGESIEKFVDIGTPHLGSPKAYKILNYGDNFGFEKFGFNLLNPRIVKEITQNMPAVYQLLPSENYFDESDPNYRYYVFNGVNGNSRLSYEETKTYMTTNGRNGLLVERADEFHQEIDELNPEEYGVETYNFVGCGTPTIGQFYILDEEDGHYTYNIKMINGDGTVPLRSAEAMQARETFYVRNAQHAVMPSTTGVKELVANLLTSTSTEDIDISSYSNLSRTSQGCSVPNGKLVSFHSPIELHIYDSSGNHTGPNSDGDIENEIDGVVYEVIDDNKFAFLPDGVEYTVRGSATNVGSFDVRIQELVNGEVASTTVYAGIPLTLTSQTNFVVSNNLPDSIPVDHENDDVFESSYPVSTTTVGLLETTGKVALVEIPLVVVEESQNSRSQFTRVENLTVNEIANEILVATTTEELDEINNFEIREETETVSEISIPVEPEELQPATPTEEVVEEGFENTAVVYKSVGYKLWEMFYVIWVWILNLFS